MLSCRVGSCRLVLVITVSELSALLLLERLRLRQGLVATQVGQVITLSSFTPTLTADNQLNGFWINVAGNIRIIIGSTALGVLTLDRALDAADGTSNGADCVIFGRRFRILPAGYAGWYIPGQALLAEPGYPIVTITATAYD